MLNPVKVSNTSSGKQNTLLSEIDHLDEQLFLRFKSKFIVHPSLSRLLVSSQANKIRPVYRRYKFKEAFSAALVEYLFHKYKIASGRILDPFAGSGTTLFVASAMGIDADSIELLPIGLEIISVKQILDAEFTPEDFERLHLWMGSKLWNQSETRLPLPELRITRGAYPEKTKESIEKYLGACQQENTRVQAVLCFALLCVCWSRSVLPVRMDNISGGTIDLDAHKARKSSIKVRFWILIRPFVLKSTKFCRMFPLRIR